MAVNFADPRYKLTDAEWHSSVGYPVVVDGHGKGNLEYFGPLKPNGHNVLGVILRDPKGNSDGTLSDGSKVFHCEKKYGVFVAPNEAILLEHWNDAMESVELRRRSKKTTPISKVKRTNTIRTKSPVTPTAKSPSPRKKFTPVTTTLSRPTISSSQKIATVTSRINTGRTAKKKVTIKSSSTTTTPTTTASTSTNSPTRHTTTTDTTTSSSRPPSSPRRSHPYLDEGVQIDIKKAAVKKDIKQGVRPQSMAQTPAARRRSSSLSQDTTPSIVTSQAGASSNKKEGVSPDLPVTEPTRSEVTSPTNTLSTGELEHLTATALENLMCSPTTADSHLPPNPSPTSSLGLSSPKSNVGLTPPPSGNRGVSSPVLRRSHSPSLAKKVKKIVIERQAIGADDTVKAEKPIDVAAVLKKIKSTEKISTSSWRHGSAEKTAQEKMKKDLEMRLAIEEEVRQQDNAQFMEHLTQASREEAAVSIKELEKRWAMEDEKRNAIREKELEKRKQEDIARAQKFEKLRLQREALLGTQTKSAGDLSLQQQQGVGLRQSMLQTKRGKSMMDLYSSSASVESASPRPITKDSPITKHSPITKDSSLSTPIDTRVTQTTVSPPSVPVSLSRSVPLSPSVPQSPSPPTSPQTTSKIGSRTSSQPSIANGGIVLDSDDDDDEVVETSGTSVDEHDDMSVQSLSPSQRPPPPRRRAPTLVRETNTTLSSSRIASTDNSTTTTTPDTTTPSLQQQQQLEEEHTTTPPQQQQPQQQQQQHQPPQQLPQQQQNVTTNVENPTHTSTHTSTYTSTSSVTPKSSEESDVSPEPLSSASSHNLTSLTTNETITSTKQKLAEIRAQADAVVSRLESNLNRAVTDS